MTEGVALHEVVYDKSGKPVDYRITDCNESYTLLTGIPREKAIGQIASGLYNTETAPYLDIYSNVVQSGNSTNFEVYFEPMKKHFNISVVPLGGERFATVFTDFTQRINYEQELQSSKEKAEEMNRLKTNFLANMSHELRTPMVAILGFSEMLSTYDKDIDVQEMSSMIYNGSKRLMGTLNMILDLTRLESDKMEINKSNVDLKKLLIEEINLYTPIASKNSLYLKQDIENESFIFHSDEKTLRSIIDNLINNAIKFTYKGGVTIKLHYKLNNKKEKEFIEIRIIDTGIGISEKSRNMIFEEFRQVSEGLNRRFEGAGLGLTITKRFVDLLGGKIDFESEIGKGTTFIVQFPVKEMKINVLKETNKDFEKQKSIKPANMKKSAKHKILFVDDDETSLKLVELLLKNVCDVEFASEGMEAINKSKDNDYDAILMDINLGRGIDGVTAAKEIRKTEKYNKKPIVALTAFAMKGDKEEFLNAGFTHYISKPFTKQNLLDLMKKILD
jgi:signal transduction histidine kinase